MKQVKSPSRTHAAALSEHAPRGVGATLRAFINRLEAANELTSKWHREDGGRYIGTRRDPATSFEVADPCWSTPIDPKIGPDDRQRRNFTGSRGIIDACKPFHWIKEFPPTSTIAEQDFEETMRKWGSILSTSK